MFPAVLAGAVGAATQVAMERWLRADPPVPMAPLIRQALAELSDPRLTMPLPEKSDQPPPASP
jgi:hypothetical protein